MNWRRVCVAHPIVLPLQIFLFCTYIVLYILYMMSSLGGDKARGPREKTLPTVTHSSQPQKQIQVRSHLPHWELIANARRPTSTVFFPRHRNRYNTAECRYTNVQIPGKGELTFALHVQCKKNPTHPLEKPKHCLHYRYIFSIFVSWSRLLQSKSALPRWSMTRTTLTLSAKSTRWGWKSPLLNDNAWG